MSPTILSFKHGHDGSVACVQDGRLLFAYEGEKDSNRRYAPLSPTNVLDALTNLDRFPDVLAVGGWYKHLPGFESRLAGGYSGLRRPVSYPAKLFGRDVAIVTSSHERSHIMMAAGLAPTAPLEECIVLLWEGVFGSFYHWRDWGSHLERLEVMREPGARYAALFALADVATSDAPANPPDDAAGKLMALAAFGTADDATPDERSAVDRILTCASLYPFHKAELYDTALYNVGVESPSCHRAAAYLTDAIYERFAGVAQAQHWGHLPLLIVGGCGLNCDWNSRWRASGLFSDIVVSPVANDAGSAIGTAIDALVSCGAPCKIDWSVYAGLPFCWDIPRAPTEWIQRPFTALGVAARVRDGNIVALVQDRCEIGPRALGHRSLIGSPLRIEMTDRLNTLKSRDSYRPIAPCCLAEELSHWFDPAVDDPYMLHFASVLRSEIPAVTHVDGSARVQSVPPSGPETLRQVLEGFKQLTGVPVLCNTSLNHPGRGFINRASELFSFAHRHELKDLVIDNAWYSR